MSVYKCIHPMYAIGTNIFYMEGIMDNSKLIQDFLREHKRFLQANHIDVAHSLVSDDWFVYCYDPEYNQYVFFTRFDTVEQLIDIILKEMTFTLRLFLDDELSPPDFEEDPYLADLIDKYTERTTTKSELKACLDHIIETNSLHDVAFLKALKDLLEYPVETE